MLREYFFGKEVDPLTTNKDSSQKESPLKKTIEVVEMTNEVSEEELEAKRESDFRRKLRESAREPPPQPHNLLTYDSALRVSSRILMDGNMGGDAYDGFQVNVSRNAHNAMMSSKWHLGNPQVSHWEVGLQMNGFNDVVSASYNTLSRWQLMYQRMFTSGALGVLQFMAQPQAMAMGGPPGTFFGMLQHPWVWGGCSQFQYIKPQQMSLSHMQRVIRGVHVGSQLTFELPTQSTHTSFVFSASRKSSTIAAEIKPSSGEWKVAATKMDWATDTEFACQLEFVEKRTGKLNLLSMGLRKQLVGGGQVQAVLSGFSKVRTLLELPFGGERVGYNAVRVTWGVQYDIGTGKLSQGLSFIV